MEISTMGHAMQLHVQILKTDTNQTQKLKNLSKLFTFTALSPSGDLNYAHSLLTSLPTSTNSYYHNTLIRAYARSPDPAHHFHSLSLFLDMLHDPTPSPDSFTYPFVFKSCARLRLTRFGKQLHGLVFKSGFWSDTCVLNSLIHFYFVCDESDHAHKVFDKVTDRDVVSWTTMIDGLVDSEQPVKAIHLFDRMVKERIGVNEVTVVSVLRACAETGSLSVGRRVHGLVEERIIGLEAKVSTALINMYAKCGCIDSAIRVFDEIVDKDVFAWTAMINGLATHGRYDDAIDLFNKMECFDVKPDERTMTAVLSACRNAGLINEAFKYLEGMRKKHGVKPTIQHYGCMVDLLARAGHLRDAEEIVRKMPIEPDVVMWRTLIWACKVHGDTIRGDRLMKHLELLETDGNDCGSYVLVGNVYASAGKWQDKARMRELMNWKGLVKPPGSSKIEANGAIHEFTLGDSTHPEADNIYGKLDEVEERLREEGYRPKVSEVLLEIEDEKKAFQLWHHSEKLALAYGLIRTNPGDGIRIVKNLRSCEDCHEVMKLTSRIYRREIVVRDRIRFHYFRNGECSCKDLW